MPSFNSPTAESVLAAAQQLSGRLETSLSHEIDRWRAVSEVLPRLYLTDVLTACNEKKLSALGITHVVSVLEYMLKYPQTHLLRTLHIPLSDTIFSDILTHLPTTTSFIHDALSESPDSRVMVHCLGGMSRSATVICAYLIATAKMTPHEAIATVRAKRGIVCPNLGFRRQLGKYANQLHGGRSGTGARLAKMGEDAAGAIRKLTGRAQEEPNTRP